MIYSNKKLSFIQIDSCLCDLLGRGVTPIVKGQWFESWSGQVKDWKIGTCCLPG